MRLSIARLCVLLFIEFRDRCHLSPEELADFIERYSLVDFIEDCEDEINSFGPGGHSEYLIEPYIREKGGVISPVE